MASKGSGKPRRKVSWTVACPYGTEPIGMPKGFREHKTDHPASRRGAYHMGCRTHRERE